MKLSVFFLGAALAALLHREYTLALVLFIAGALAVVALLPQSACTRNCREGRACTCCEQPEQLKQ